MPTQGNPSGNASALPEPCLIDGIPLIFEDESCLVLNKPSGLLSVPGRGVLAHDSVAQRVQQVVPEARVVHRLDMATSGLMLMAKSLHWQRVYSKLFEQRQIDKSYVAIVCGVLSNDRGEVDLPLITDWPNRPKQRVDAQSGKPSFTRYTVLERCLSTRTTRLLLEPITGRSHQLRVHMLALGHPIMGDMLYAPNTCNGETSRLMLHAQQLGLIHPLTHEAVCWRSPAPF